MGDAEEFDVESAHLKRFVGCDDFERHLIFKAMFPQFQFQQLGGKLRTVHIAFQLRPQPRHGADMVLMGVGDDEACEVSFV